jgi:hypothetical protein
MEITFTKTGARGYEVVARRDDKVVVRIGTPDRPEGLPHDMAHYLVERGLGIERGFWGAVAAGAVFKGVEVVSGRRPPHAAERSKAVIKAGYRQLATAELYVSVFQAVAREGKERDLAYVNARLDDVWRPFRWPRKAVTREGVLRVCEAMREAEKEWRELPVGGSVTVSWRAAR